MHSMNSAAIAIALATQAMMPTLAGAGEVFQRPEPAPGFSYPEYYCTNRGVRVEVEETACLTVGQKSFVAKCDISLNNPMWRPTGEMCDPPITTQLSTEGVEKTTSN